MGPFLTLNHPLSKGCRDSKSSARKRLNFHSCFAEMAQISKITWFGLLHSSWGIARGWAWGQRLFLHLQVVIRSY